MIFGYGGLLETHINKLLRDKINLPIHCEKRQRGIDIEKKCVVLVILHHLSNLLLGLIQVRSLLHIFPHSLVNWIIVYPSEITLLDATKA